MIVKFDTPADKKDARIKLFKDDIFVMALGAIGKVSPKLSVEELFANANHFTQYLVENDLSDPDIMQYEVDELRKEVSDNLSYYLIIALAFIKLCALRKTRPNAENIARTLNRFCQEYEGFADFLKQLYKKEQLMERRVGLLTYELQTIGTTESIEDGHKIMNAIVEVAKNTSYEGVEKLELVVSEVNEKFGNRYQEELDKLRAIRASKSQQNINIERVNDIHDNPYVNIGNK